MLNINTELYAKSNALLVTIFLFSVSSDINKLLGAISNCGQQFSCPMRILDFKQVSHHKLKATNFRMLKKYYKYLKYIRMQCSVLRNPKHFTLILTFHLGTLIFKVLK